MSKTVAILSVAVILMVPLGAYLSAQEPCGVESIEAHIYNNCNGGEAKWIYIRNETTVCQVICLAQDPKDPEAECGINPSWIGGTVQIDENDRYHFNFDPKSVVLAETVPLAARTSICQIAANPKAYEGSTWYIPFNLLGTR
jgi:hypothetical protein